MRKLLHIILTLSMLLSLCACGSETDAKEKDTLLSIGDTAEGSSCSVTVTSVEFVDKIENGFLEHMWSPTTRDTYKDVTAEEGYAIVKISYHFDYTGKESGAIPISFVLNYDDGYTFEGGYIFSEGYSTNGAGGHALPAITNTTKIGFEEKYVFGGRTRFEIDDPLEFQETDAFTYIFVNDAVKTNTDKSYVLEVSIPSVAYDDIVTIDVNGQLISPETPELETFVYNLREQ